MDLEPSFNIELQVALLSETDTDFVSQNLESKNTQEVPSIS